MAEGMTVGQLTPTENNIIIKYDNNMKQVWEFGFIKFH